MKFDSNDLRAACSHFATGVCIVGIRSLDTKGAMAMTINSFSSLSLSPPLVLWSLQKTSEVFEEFSTASEFSLSILADDQRDISGRYSRKNQHDLDSGHFRELSGIPVIAGSLAGFICQKEVHIDAGDHVIITGRVEEVWTNVEDKLPLLFYKGAYRTL